MTMNTREFSTLLAQFSKGRNAVGCTASEIETLERNLNTSLPDDYKLFLRTCGHGVDDFMKGSDFKYGELADLQEAARELIDESNATAIPFERTEARSLNGPWSNRRPTATHL